MTATRQVVTARQPCALLPWDSELFGMAIARVSAGSLGAEAAEAVDEWCAERAVSCTYLLAPFDDAATVLAAADAGFRPVDVRVTLERPAAPPSGNGSLPAVPVREADPDDCDRLAEIARMSHRATRFYFDQRFPRQLSDALYESWVRSCVNDPGQIVLVAEGPAGPVGYAALRPLPEPAQIVLFAVSESARGVGVGSGLLDAALRRLELEGAARVRVVTQARNVPALRLYEHGGFRISSTELWLHKWFDEP